MYLSKTPLRFVKIFIFLLAVLPEILSEISPFALFLVQKYLKKHDVPCKKTVTFCENCRSITRGFPWKHVWNLTFCPLNRNFNTDPSKKQGFLSPPPQIKKNRGDWWLASHGVSLGGWWLVASDHSPATRPATRVSTTKWLAIKTVGGCWLVVGSHSQPATKTPTQPPSH